MTIKTRRILLGIAVLAFATIGFVLLMYARGYRWDFDNNRFLLSGAIYIKPSHPSDTQIILNGKNTGETSAALIKSLLPTKKYQAQVLKEGYQSWAKEFTITAGLVANAENIILFPQKLASQIIWPETKNLDDFSISPDEKTIAIKISPSKIFTRDLTNISATSTELKFADKRKTQAVALIKNNRGWSADSRKLVFSRETSGKKLWYIWDSETKTASDLTSFYERKIILKQASALPLPTKFAPAKIAWFGSNNLLVLLNGRLFELDIQNETAIDLKLNDIADFDIWDNKIAALKNPDILLFMDSAVENISVLGQAKFAPQNILISPDESKIAYANGQTLGVFWLKDTDKQPLKKSGDQEVIYQTSGKISNFYWHASNEHLIFLENQNLKAAELDTRDKINLASWPETILTLDYLPQEAKLYILENSAVKVIEREF